MSFRLLFVFVLLAHHGLHAIHLNVTSHPTTEWTERQIAEAFPWDSAPHYLLHDRDCIYGAAFHQQVGERFLKKTVAEFRGATGGRQWRRTVYQKIREEENPITKLCRAAEISRAGYYRFIKPVAEKAEEMKLRDAIQQLAVEMPAYGYRRITAALQHAGWEANHKRVLRLMRADNLLCLRKRAFVRTTDSNHELRIYPNLARELKPSGLNQLWVADITYIRLLLEFVYLAVILDAFSRRVIGWALGRTLEAKLALEALRMALGRGRVPGLVHHSDRGVQYASKDYVELLTEHGILISMSRPGNPYDNAQAESFIKTLKYEEVYRTEHLDFADAGRGLGKFIESVYNEKRLHSAFGYLSPAEFERQQLLLPAALVVGQA